MNAMMPVIPRSGSRKVNGYVKAVLALDAVHQQISLPGTREHEPASRRTTRGPEVTRLWSGAHSIS